MKIIDKNGKVLTEKPDLTLGRLEQGSSSDTLVYKTWADFPPVDEEGRPIDIDQPTEFDKVEAQVTYTAIKTGTLLPIEEV